MAVDGDPDLIPAAKLQDLRSESFVALDTLTNTLYKYVTGRPLGNRWDAVEFSDNQQLRLSRDTIYLERGGFVVIKDLVGVSGVPATYDLNQPVLREVKVGDIVYDSIGDFSNWAAFHYYRPPTLLLEQTPKTYVFERGTQNTLQYVSTTSNPGAATLSQGSVRANGTPISNFGSSVVATYTFQFNPAGSTNFTGTEYIIQSQQNYTHPSGSGVASSNPINISGVYPVLYGMSQTDLFSGGDIYTALSKDVSREGDKSYFITGRGFIYFAIPLDWDDDTLAHIFDTNDFEQTGSFTPQIVSVSSSGLSTNWTHSYRVYKLKTETVILPENAANYKIKR